MPLLNTVRGKNWQKGHKRNERWFSDQIGKFKTAREGLILIGIFLLAYDV